MRYGYIAPYDYSDRMYDGDYDEIPYPKDFLIKNPNFSANEYDTELPCWSLAALRNLLPVGIKINKNTYLFGSHNTFDKCWVYRYYNEDDTSYLYCKNTNEVDACVEMIIKLSELKML